MIDFIKKKSIVDKINEIIIMLLNYPYYLLMNSIKLSLFWDRWIAVYIFVTQFI
jgi:hypothetical protein